MNWMIPAICRRLDYLDKWERMARFARVYPLWVFNTALIIGVYHVDL